MPNVYALNWRWSYLCDLAYALKCRSVSFTSCMPYIVYVCICNKKRYNLKNPFSRFCVFVFFKLCLARLIETSQSVSAIRCFGFHREDSLVLEIVRQNKFLSDPCSFTSVTRIIMISCFRMVQPFHETSNQFR